MTISSMDDDHADSAARYENDQSPRGPHAVSDLAGHCPRAGTLLWGPRSGLPNHAGDGLAASQGPDRRRPDRATACRAIQLLPHAAGRLRRVPTHLGGGVGGGARAERLGAGALAMRRTWCARLEGIELFNCFC